jgi:hypothetical protein
VIGSTGGAEVASEALHWGLVVVGDEKESSGRAFAKHHELICDRMDLHIARVSRKGAGKVKAKLLRGSCRMQTEGCHGTCLG